MTMPDVLRPMGKTMRRCIAFAARSETGRVLPDAKAEGMYLRGELPTHIRRKKKVPTEYTRGGHSLRNVFGIMTPLEWGRMQKENWHIVISA